MQLADRVLRAMSVLGIAATFAACSSSASSANITPAGNAPHSQWRPAERVGPDNVVEFAYVINYSTSNVSAFQINGHTGTLTAVTGSPFATGANPIDVAVEPRGKFAYVTNNASNNVWGYRILSNGALYRMHAPFPAGTGPQGIATCRVASGTCKPAPL